VTKLPVDGISIAMPPASTEKLNTNGAKMNQNESSERLPRILRKQSRAASFLEVSSGAETSQQNPDDPANLGLFFGLEELFSLVIHSGKNHLGPIKGYASLIQDDNDEHSSSRRWADKIVRNVRRMEDYFELLNMYRLRGAIGIRDMSWQHIVSSVMDRFAAVNVKGVPTEIINDTSGTFSQHGNLVARVLTHLVINAYESIESTGKLTVTIDDRGHTSDGRRSFEVRVKDTGCGIDKNNSDMIWKPFYTTKHDHIGLGLSYVAAAAPVLGMTVEVNSSSARGTTVGLVLSEQGG
jgi:signal transduction histidine kinase